MGSKQKISSKIKIQFAKLNLGDGEGAGDEDGHVVGTVRAIPAARNIDESFMICDLDQLIVKYREWMAHLPGVKPYFVVKSNSDSLVIKTLAKLGVGFYCVSKAEMETVIACGASPSRIIYTHPVKLGSYIVTSRQLGVTLTCFDSVGELRKLHNLYPQARLLIRVLCANATGGGPGSGRKFGVLCEDVPALLEHARELGLNVVGVCFHLGHVEPGNEHVYGKYIAEAAVVFQTGKRLGFHMNVLDIGGGFPGGSAETECFAKVASVIKDALSTYFPTHDSSEAPLELIAEPGIYFVATAYTLVTQVHLMREIVRPTYKEVMYFINDGIFGSLNNSFFECVYKHEYERQSPEADMAPETVQGVSTIWGPTGTEMDRIWTGVNLPRLEIGDYLCFKDIGGYSTVIAGTFHGFPVARIFYCSEMMTTELQDEVEFLNNLDEALRPGE